MPGARGGDVFNFHTEPEETSRGAAAEEQETRQVNINSRWDSMLILLYLTPPALVTRRPALLLHHDWSANSRTRRSLARSPCHSARARILSRRRLHQSAVTPEGGITVGPPTQTPHAIGQTAVCQSDACALESATQHELSGDAKQPRFL
ncbi:unnamed protein product [Pleuronectes platessa]|uniref:Uncharacterized protein n=1 Tax=Pleuronectes platessa TaxID=8262 RepID=A0A9N7YTB1_PLEPL|nr:unnamed protein product [Pleuronectes platessa]